MKTKIFILLIGLLTEYGYCQFFQIELDNPKRPGKVLETDEFSYVTQLYRDTPLSELSQISIQKFDKNGKQNSSLRIEDNNGGYEIFSTNDNGILLIMTEGTSSSPQIKAIKFDKHLNKLWEKTLPSDNQNFSAAYKDIDGSIYLTTYSTGSYSFIRKFNSDLDPLWKSESIAAYVRSFYKLNDFYLGINSQMIIRISNSFTIDFEITTPYEIRDNVIIDNNLFISLRFKSLLLKYNLDGNFIDSINTSRNVEHLSKSADNHLLVTLVTGEVIKYSAEGNIVWSVGSPNSSYKINKSFSLADNSMLFCLGTGMQYYVKGTENGYYKFFHNFSGLESIGYNNSVNMRWHSANVDKVDISYLDYLDNEVYIIKGYQLIHGLNAFQCDIPKNLKKILIKDSAYPDFLLTYGFSELERSYPHYDFLSANNIKIWIAGNGIGSQSPYYNLTHATLQSTWKSLYDSVKSIIFVDGLTWGGVVDGNIQVNGSRHRTGLKAGNIINKHPADPSAINYAPFKIRKGWENLAEGIEKSNYEYCFNNWPIYSGADWLDKNGDGIYTIGIDEPLFWGDEVIFYVANDLDTSRVNFATGCDPIGLEFRTTVYAFDSTNFLSDVVFKRYVIINKSEKEINDMYFCYFSDSDLGNGGDDYTGCDSSLNLGYVWNVDNYDGGFGYNPPAAGHMIVQGPIVPSDETDKAKFKGEFRNGYKNLPMTSFSPDWNMEIGNLHEDAMAIYNYIFKGLDYNWRVPMDYLNPHTGIKTLFPLSGDPESGIGWYEGAGWPGGVFRGSRDYWLTSGPFIMAPSDTQEVVIAIIVAQGTSNLNSVTKLKEKAQLVQEFYNQYKLVSPNERPIDFTLNQNFPNPFNNITTIRYSIKEKTHVRIKLYDILGREITTLVNEEKVPWTYDVRFDASNLASGVYIYRMEAGDFIQSKKMILLK